jgi:hypothetical protein
MRVRSILFPRFVDFSGSSSAHPLPHDVFHFLSVECFVGEEIVHCSPLTPPSDLLDRADDRAARSSAPGRPSVWTSGLRIAPLCQVSYLYRI